MAQERTTHTKRQHVEYQEDIPDIDQGLNDLTKETTVRDLMRRGQHKKLRTIREHDLKEWIATALRRVMVTHEDTFTDEQKEEMVAKVQAEMQQRIQSLQEQAKAAEAGAQEWRNQYQKAISEAGENQQLQDVLERMQAKYENAQAEREEAVMRLLEMEDSFNENKSMLATTIAEKERLQATNRELFMRSSHLIEPILSIDNEHYQGSHQEQTPGSEEDEDSFFRDFEVSTHVLETIQGDLGQGTGPAGPAAQAAVDEVAEEAKPATLREDHLLTLYEASDQALSKLSGMLDVETAEELEEQADGGQQLIDSEPIAKLHHKIILLGRGISLQRDRLQHLEAENADLRTQQGSNGESQAAARHIAETLAAAAIPLKGAGPVDEQLQECAAALEEVLAAEDDDLNAVQERADAVIATIVAERQRLGTDLQDQQRRAAAAEDALRKLAGAAAAAVCAEGQEDDSELGTATGNLRKDLDTPADLVPGGNEQLLADISVDGAQVIAQLREERDAAREQAAAIRASERALAQRLLELSVDSDDDAVLSVAGELRQAMDANGEESLNKEIAATTQALAEHGTRVAGDQLASSAQLEDVQQRLSAAEQAADEHQATISELRERNETLQAQLDQRDSELAELETRLAEDEEQLGAAREELSAAKDQLTALQAGQEGVAEAISQIAKEHQQAMVELEQDGEEDDALASAADQVQELVAAEGEHDPDQVLDATRGVIARLRVANDALTQRLRRKEQELRDARRSTEAEAESLDELKKALAQAEAERQQSKQDAEALQDEVATLNKRIDQAAEEALVKEEEIESLRQQIADAQAQLAEKEQQAEELNQRLEAAAEEGLTKEEELETLRAANQEAAEHAQALAALREQLQESQTDLATTKEELEHAHAALGEAEENMEAKQEEAEKQAQALAELQEQCQASEASLSSAQEERDQAQAALAEAQEALKAKQAEAEEQTETIAQLEPLQQRCEDLQTQVAQAQEEQTAQQEELEGLRLRVDEMEAACAGLRTERDDLSQKVADLEQQLQDAQAHGLQAEELQRSLSDSSNRLDELQSALTAREQALAESQQALSDRDSSLADLQQRLGENEAALAEAKAQVQAADEVQQSLQEELQGRDGKLAELEEQVAEQARRLSELEALRSELEATQQEQTAAHERCLQLEQLLAERDGQISSQIADLAQAEEREQLLNDQLEALRDELEQYRRSLRNAEARICELEAREQQLEADFEKDLADLRKQLEDEEDAHAAVRQRLDNFEEDHVEVLASLRGRLQDAESARTRLQQQVSEQGDELASIKQSHEHDANRLQRLDEELAALQLQRDELRQQLRQVEHDLEEERNTRCGWEARKERLQKDHQEQLDGVRQRLQKARDDLHAMQSETRHLREDNVGLRSRLRSLEAGEEDPAGNDELN